MLKRWNFILNCAIGSFFGGFVGYSIYEYFHYKKNPGLYEIQSAPWYTGIQVYGLITLTIIFIIMIIKLIINKKAKRSVPGA
ncbi:MAG TPA: hypothetical protein GX526_06905 [Thermoanaerobacterales bacterium]|nr:hypothetical protein [Thermoanaerobacterales bacterium]